jgi:P4 family phage/plasmid primase-like protien
MTVQAQQGVPAYAIACMTYYQAGWPCIIPVPPVEKDPPPGGFTGADGRDTTLEDLAAWSRTRPDYSIALRMPDGVVGIDVDEYVKGTVTKTGAQTLAAKTAEWGPLPATYSSTARGQDQPSRIRFYQVPPGRYASRIVPDIEIIQRHHRYAVVAPSLHPGASAAYTWYRPDGAPMEMGVPRPEDLPWLPQAWAEGLAAAASQASPASAGAAAGYVLLNEILKPGEGPCVEVASSSAAGRSECTAAQPGSRHDLMTERAWSLVQLGAEGHPGCAEALLEMQGLWAQLTAGEGREHEFQEMVTTAAGKAVTKLGGTKPVSRDPCLLMGMGAQAYAAPAPDGSPDMAPMPIAAPRFWSPREAIGTWAFEPAGELDAVLAQETLMRLYPALRYAPDAGAWVVRGPDRWDVRKGDLAKWGVDQVSWLMLPGDPQEPEGSEQWTRARKRARFTTNASSNAIAAKMHAQVSAGQHPATVELAALDGDREILWAGGWPWDLRQSAEYPRVADGYDPGTPHLHSAGVVPDPTAPTPLWDQFLAAVWPDEDLRAWAVRVLSIAVTGYSDKALPIMLGETDRGKTSVIDLMMSVLGSYAHVADARLLSPADKSHASIVYALRGRRLSFIDEAPRAGSLATERLKQITGGAELTGNRMGENPVTFKPTHTLILTANPEHEPNLLDPAIRRRVRLIPCNGDPAEVIRIRSLIGSENSTAWRAEAPGVLARMMRQAALWLADPGTASNEGAPESGKRAVHDIREDQNIVAAWVREECEPWTQGTRSRDLYMAFTESCRRMAIHQSAIPSETRWGRELNSMDYPRMHRADANYRALRIRPPQVYAITPGEFLGTSGGASGPRGGSTLQEWSVQGTSAQPSTNGNPAGQTLHQTLHPEELKGNDMTTTHIRAHTHTRTQGGKPSSLQPSIPPLDPLPGMPDLPPEDSSQPVTEPEKPKRKPKTEKVRPDPAYEGPVYDLPVIVARNPEAPDALPLVLPCTLAQAVAAAEGALAELDVDVETTGFPPGHPDYGLRLVQLGDEFTASVFDPDDEAHRAAIADLIARAAMLHAHSAAADLVPLAMHGLGNAAAMWDKMTDSVLIAKLIDPAQATSDADGLKKLSGDLLGAYAVSPPAEAAKGQLFKSGGWLMETDALTPLERSGWAMVRKSCATFLRYAGSDVLDLGGVIRVLPRPDPDVLARERRFQAMCARISHQGFRLDPAHIRAKITEYEQAQAQALERVRAACPAITNPSSTKEVPAALAAMGIPLERTAAGNLSAAKGELERLAKTPGYEHAELLRDILEYRHDVTTLGLLLRPLNVLCERGDGRMRPVVYTINADTGRTSCRRPNSQQFSRQGGIRACVIADEGMAGISADFSGVEIRVAAALAGDPDLLRAELSTMCQACGNDPCAPWCGKDQKGLHWMAARMAFGPDATKEDRYNSKRLVFSKLFGGGPESGARQVGVPQQDAAAVHRAFEAIAPRFTAWDQEMRAWVKAGNRGFRAYSGRTIWLPPKHRPHASGNYAIQGSAREFLVDGCLRWEQTRWGHLPLLPIHDEIFTWVPEAEAAEASAALIECMRSELYGVPIEAKASEPFFAWPDSS